MKAMMNKITCLIFILLGLYQSAEAQQDRFRWRVGVYGGVNNYYGELEKRLFPPNPFLTDDWNTDYLTYGVSLENTFSRSWSWKAVYTNGKFLANDVRRNWNNEIETDSPNFLRGLNAQTEIQDFSLLMTYYTDNGKLFGRKSFLSPYFSFGAGVSNFEVFGDLRNAQGQEYFYWTDQTIRDQPEGTPGAQEIAQDGVFESNLSQDNPANYNTTVLNIQAGLGFKIRLGGRFNLNLETIIKQTFTDNLDNFESPDDSWNDAYSFTSASLHYNFGKRTQTFRSPKIYSSAYPKEMSITQKDSLGRSPDMLNFKTELKEIESEEMALQEDSIIVYQNDKVLERIATNKIYKYDTAPYTYTPSIIKYQTEGSRVLQRDTTYLTTDIDTPQKKYVIEERIYRPQTQDTLRVRRYVRDTVRIVKTVNPDYQPLTRLESMPEGSSAYRYNPYQSSPNTYNAYRSPESNYASYDPSNPNRTSTTQGTNYNYGTTPNGSNTRNSTVITPIIGFGQSGANPNDSTALSSEQRLNVIEDKLDLVAWHILKMQQDRGELNLSGIVKNDSLSKSKFVLDSLKQIPIKIDSIEVSNTLTGNKVNTTEVVQLRSQVQALENKIANLQKEVNTNTSKKGIKVLGQMKIVFASGVYSVDAANKSIIKEFIVGRTDNNFQYALQGFSDKVGDAQQNLILSKMRADAVRNVLMELGVDMSQISSDFYGSSIQTSNERKVEIILMER